MLELKPAPGGPLVLESPARYSVPFAAAVLIKEPTFDYVMCEYAAGKHTHAFRLQGVTRCTPKQPAAFSLVSVGADRQARKCAASAAACALSCEAKP